MAGVKDVVIRAQALDGTWDTLGAASARGIWPEDTVNEYDAWGPSKASFNLRRDPGRAWPDIGPFTPIEIEIGGVLVWDGRVAETPSHIAERLMNVQAEGWQYHLDDDIVDVGYVHNDLTAWKDLRSASVATLGSTHAFAGGNVSSGDGALLLQFPNGVPAGAGAFAGVYLDLGPGRTAASISIDYETSNHAGWQLFAESATSPDPVSGAVSIAINAADLNATLGPGPTSTRGTFSTPARYVLLFLLFPAGGTPGADVWIKIKGARVFTNDAYRSTDASILKASDVVLDGLAKGTVLFSSDRSGVQATSTSIPTFWPTDPKTVRENWLAVDAYHNWLKQIRVGRLPIYRALTALTSPVIEFGPWSAALDEDASANSGEEIYNGAVIAGQTPDGQPIRVPRFQPSSDFSYLAAQQFSNPSFDTNTTGWTTFAAGTITRDTGVFDSSPASLRLTSGVTGVSGVASQATAGSGLPGTLTASLTVGRAYRFRFRIRLQAAATDLTVQIVPPNFAGSITDFYASLPFTTGQFATYVSPVYVVQSGGELPVLFVNVNGTASTILAYIDSCEILEARPTIVDRRRFQRRKILQINNPLPSDLVAAAEIGDAWLPGHKSTPFKGQVTAIGNGAARNVLTGEDVPPERLGLMVMEPARFSNRVDPDTGGHGRDGRMVGVRYTHAEDKAEVTIDNANQDFEALLARYGVLAGTG